VPCALQRSSRHAASSGKRGPACSANSSEGDRDACPGEQGWELCGAFPAAQKGSKRALPGTAELRETADAVEVVALIFKKA
jgi:hypothetical protein